MQCRNVVATYKGWCHYEGEKTTKVEKKETIKGVIRMWWWSGQPKKKEKKKTINQSKKRQSRVAWKKLLQNKEKINQLRCQKDVDNNQPMMQKKGSNFWCGEKRKQSRSVLSLNHGQWLSRSLLAVGAI